MVRVDAVTLEVWIKPKHMATALGSSSSLADAEYLWLISNPIYITTP